MPPSYPKCSLLGRNKLKSIVTAKLAVRIITGGVITIRNTMNLRYVKAPSQQLSDAMLEAFKDRLKAD